MRKYLCLFLIMMFFYGNSSYAIINDDFADKTLNKNLKIHEYKNNLIIDDLITENFIQKYKNENYKQNIFIIDDFANKNLAEYKNEKFISYIPLNFKNFQKINLKLKPEKDITTKDKNLKEGSSINFVLTEDFSYNNKYYKKGTILKSKIENISQNHAFGIPANLELGNFKIDNTTIDGILKIQGADRSIWVIPAGYIGCCFFGAGILIFPVRGGHAKLNKNKIYNFSINDFS